MKVLIAGASGGIGSYIYKMLSRDGHQVHGTFNSTYPTDDLNLQRVDVTDESQVHEWISSFSFTNDEKIALVNCVGINYNSQLHKSDTELWTKVIETNLISSFLLIKHIIPYMRERKYGRVMLLSSVVPKIGVPGTSAYSASKAALWGLTKTAAIENAKYGITFNALNLGYFSIGMISDVPEETLKKIKSQIPSGDLGDPINIYNAIKYILDSSYVTGSQIDINGGIV